MGESLPEFAQSTIPLKPCKKFLKLNIAMRNSFLHKILIFALLTTSMAGQLGLVCDWASFRGDSVGTAWLEFYTKLNRENFRFAFDSTINAFVGTLGVKIIITDSLGEKIDSIAYIAPIKLAPNEPITRSFRILNIHTISLPIGTYTITTTAKDYLSEIEDTFTTQAVLRNFWDKQYAVSDIMLAASAEKTTIKDQFERFGKRMLPNPSAIFDLNSPAIYYYVEFYIPKGEAKYGLNTKLLVDGKVYKNFGTLWQKGSDYIIYINGFPIAGIADGEYELVISLVDSTGNELAKSSKKIWIAKLPTDEKIIPNEATLQRMHNILSFLLSPKQMSEFKNLDPAGKVRFWYNFWAKNDSNPETPENEFMQEFIARWDYANAAFAQGSKTPGWKTDRGRIYIVYGPPDNVERHTFSSGTNNWEVWYYFDKNYYFIFADILGIGNMKLVDSNAPGEVHDRDWRNKIKGYHIQPSPQDRGY